MTWFCDDNNFGFSHLDSYNGHTNKTQKANTILTTQGLSMKTYLDTIFPNT